MMHIVVEPVPEDMSADLGSVRVAVCGQGDVKGVVSDIKGGFTESLYFN